MHSFNPGGQQDLVHLSVQADEDLLHAARSALSLTKPLCFSVTQAPPPILQQCSLCLVSRPRFLGVCGLPGQQIRLSGRRFLVVSGGGVAMTGKGCHGRSAQCP